MNVCMYESMLYTIVLALLHHLFTCICPSIYYYCHIIITCTHTYIHCIFPDLLLHNYYATPSPNPTCILREPNLPYTISILISITVAIQPRISTYTSPPPGDLTLPYLSPYITFCAYCIFSLPHYPPLFLPTPSSRTPMAAIIACYSVYAHYHQRGGHVCMRACPGRGMYVCGKRVSHFFALSGSFLWPH